MPSKAPFRTRSRRILHRFTVSQPGKRPTEKKSMRETEKIRAVPIRGSLQPVEKASQSLRPQAQIEFHSFSPAACTSEKIHLGSQTCERKRVRCGEPQPFQTRAQRSGSRLRDCQKYFFDNLKPRGPRMGTARFLLLRFSVIICAVCRGRRRRHRQRAEWRRQRRRRQQQGALRRLFQEREPVTRWGSADRKERRVGKECRSRWSPYH